MVSSLHYGRQRPLSSAKSAGKRGIFEAKEGA